MGMKQLNDTMTPELREQLRAFWQGQEATGSTFAPTVNPSLASQEPSIGHWPANLLFTDRNDPAGAPDPHYYNAAGQEVPEGAQEPLEGQQRAGLVVTALCLFVAAGLVVVGVLAFVVLFWPWVSACYLEVACR